MKLLDKAAKYFMRYDKVIFNHTIKKADINLMMKLSNSRKLMGVFTGYYMEDGKYGNITLSRKYRKQIKSTIIHEMVHCIQFIKGKPVNHGKFFKKEAKRIRKHFGIDIN
jgi:hypothetical protein